MRVGWEARELLATGRVTFPIPNAGWLLEIKQGRVPYAEVAGQIELLLAEVERAAEASSTLREEPDREFIDDLVARAYHEVVVKEGAK